MKKLIVAGALLSLSLLVSCTQHSGRNIASYSGGDIYEVGAIKMSVLPYNIFIERYGNVWRAFDGTTIKGSELNSQTGISVLPEGTGMILAVNYNADFEAGKPSDFFPAIITTEKEITDRGDKAIPILPVNYYIKVDSCPEDESECK
ncbi:MAG: hypothetical protein KAG61_08660 [Bacteriovoracaceae bacterium]|nr:hypothetical protein [Bacteriovoracaceae bacterium]